MGLAAHGFDGLVHAINVEGVRLADLRIPALTYASGQTPQEMLDAVRTVLNIVTAVLVGIAAAEAISGDDGRRDRRDPAGPSSPAREPPRR